MWIQGREEGGPHTYGTYTLMGRESPGHQASELDYGTAADTENAV